MGNDFNEFIGGFAAGYVIESIFAFIGGFVITPLLLGFIKNIPKP